MKQKNIEDKPARERLGLTFSYIHTENKRIFNENLPLNSKHIKEGAPLNFAKKSQVIYPCQFFLIERNYFNLEMIGVQFFHRYNYLKYIFIKFNNFFI